MTLDIGMTRSPGLAKRARKGNATTLRRTPFPPLIHRNLRKPQKAHKVLTTLMLQCKLRGAGAAVGRALKMTSLARSLLTKLPA